LSDVLAADAGHKKHHRRSDTGSSGSGFP